MQEKSLATAPEEITDDRKVRLGDGGIYFGSNKDRPAKTPPEDIDDDRAIRLGDWSPYFAAPPTE